MMPFWRHGHSSEGLNSHFDQGLVQGTQETGANAAQVAAEEGKLFNSTQSGFLNTRSTLGKSCVFHAATGRFAAAKEDGHCLE